ncbi:MAG: hypothetical protein ACLTWO_05735 [Blautia massiliensis (ex Durand et al. 2017)]|mgnify:CR=1 FL=1
MAEQNKQEAKEIIVQNSAVSFVKAMGDWLNIDKVHLSFVQHTGLKNGCKQVAAIEAALPVYRATGKMVNNVPEDNVSGLQKLSYMIDNGSFFTRLKSSRAAALDKYNREHQNPNGNDDIYCESVFEFIGGSDAKTKNGQTIPIRYRRISITPAVFKPNRRNNNIVLEALECDGSSTSTAGFVPQKGFPNKVQIRVMFKPAEFVVFIKAIMNVWQAELTRRAVCGELQFYRWRDHNKQGDKGAQTPVANEPQQTQGQSNAAVPSVPANVGIIVTYDTAGDLFIAATKEQFVTTFRNGLIKMLNTEKKWVLPSDEAKKLLDAVEKGEHLPTIKSHSKLDESTFNFINSRRVTVSVDNLNK